MKIKNLIIVKTTGRFGKIEYVVNILKNNSFSDLDGVLWSLLAYKAVDKFESLKKKINNTFVFQGVEIPYNIPIELWDVVNEYQRIFSCISDIRENCVVEMGGFYIPVL